MEIHINISGSILALYGALLSTATAVVQIMNHFRDRAKVVLKVRKNMKSLGMDQRYNGITLVIITATNAGRRPVTISGFAANLLYKENENATDWYLPDVRPPLPYEITEGREVAAFVNQNNVDFGLIACWYAWDSTGRHFRLNVAPCYKRWKSQWRRKHAKVPKENTDGSG
jgi:hypothetical protein